MRIGLASPAVLVMFLGLVAGGYVYVNRAAVGIGRVAVMFVTARGRPPVQMWPGRSPPTRDSPLQSPLQAPAAPR